MITGEHILRDPETIASELLALFQRCKELLLEQKNFSAYMDASKKISDLRNELDEIVGNRDTNDIVAKACSEAFPYR